MSKKSKMAIGMGAALMLLGMGMSMAMSMGAGTALAGSPKALLQRYAKQAGISVNDFSAARGRAFFLARHKGGKPATPSCSTCHTQNPRNAGKTRTGKRIKPMALSRTPGRFSDPKKVEKWFRRNCRSVLGRACTPREKGDFITFMMSQ